MAEERASRSVFVVNIPYEATEEALREIFAQAGQVVSFRLVYDRETGKPKGYGFCEYMDVETAQSAMRNLNNYDFNGRQLRVGIAAGEQSKDEARAMPQSSGGPIYESPYGEPVEPEKAPEAISRAVASLPPEQMFELMKQMKLCIQNNPNEARNMLLQNPQLAYALLQAQIVMKIVDPQVALAMLHRQVEQIPPVQVSSTSASAPSTQPMSQSALDSRAGLTSYSSPMGDGSMAPVQGPSRDGMMGGSGPRPDFGVSGPSAGGSAPRPRAGLLGDMPPGMGPIRPPLDPQGLMRPDMGPRGAAGGGAGMRDFPGPMGSGGGPRMVPPVGPVAPVQHDTHHPQVSGGPVDPRSRRLGGPEGSGSPLNVTGQQRDPRQGQVTRPTVSATSAALNTSAAASASSRANMSPSQSSAGAAQPVSKQDQEKAQLIMQVLQLSDEQISMLPPDQRQSILILKEQIARSAQQTN